MLRFDRKQQNSVKQLSFNKKINCLKKLLECRIKEIQVCEIYAGLSMVPGI